MQLWERMEDLDALIRKELEHTLHGQGPVQKIRFISCVLHGKEVKKKKNIYSRSKGRKKSRYGGHVRKDSGKAVAL